MLKPGPFVVKLLCSLLNLSRSVSSIVSLGLLLKCSSDENLSETEQSFDEILPCFICSWINQRIIIWIIVMVCTLKTILKPLSRWSYLVCNSITILSSKVLTRNQLLVLSAICFVGIGVWTHQGDFFSVIFVLSGCILFLPTWNCEWNRGKRALIDLWFSTTVVRDWCLVVKSLFALVDLWFSPFPSNLRFSLCCGVFGYWNLVLLL